MRRAHPHFARDLIQRQRVGGGINQINRPPHHTVVIGAAVSGGGIFGGGGLGRVLCMCHRGRLRQAPPPRDPKHAPNDAAPAAATPVKSAARGLP